MSYTLSTTLDHPYDDTVTSVREALADQGFGVLTEIDFAATLKEKLDVDVPAHIVLGACRPPLAHQALQLDPAVATVLPCNVAVRDLGDGTTRVEAFDPDAMSRLAGDVFAPVAADAKERLRKALDSLV